MDETTLGKPDEMVKVTIKRAEDSPDSKKWICKSIEDDSELEPTEEMARNRSVSLPVDGQNLNEESQNFKMRRTVIKKKKIDNRQPCRERKTENNTNTFETRLSQGTSDSHGNSCNDPTDLSRGYSKQKSPGDAENVFYQNPFEKQSSKIKFPENAYDFHNIRLIEQNQIKQGEATPYLTTTMLPQNYPLASNQRLMNSREVVAMALRTMPPTYPNFLMTGQRNSPSASGFVNSENQEIGAQGNIPGQLKQETPRPLMTNYGLLGEDARNYGHSSIAPYSDANRSCNWPVAFENNANVLPIRKESAERIEETSAKNLPQKPANKLKRPPVNCDQLDSKDATESVVPPKRKKSHSKNPRKTYNCDICDLTFKTVQGFNGHLSTENHLRNVQKFQLQQSNLHNFQPNSVSVPPRFPVIPQPHPYFQYLMTNQMLYHHQMAQAHAMNAGNQRVGGGTILNADMQKSNPGTYNSDCRPEFLGHNRFQNDLVTQRYSHDQGLMNLPINYTSNPQYNFLTPNHPQSQNSMVNPPYLENKAPQSTQCHNEPSSRFQPESSGARLSMDSPNPCASKPNQPEDLTAADPFQKLEVVLSIPRHLLELFRVYHCLVCSTFQTDDLQELERHISVKRYKNPSKFINISGEDLYCELCDFKTHSSQMKLHCTSIIHLNRLDYYYHVMRGGINAREKLSSLHVFSPISLFCAACDFSTTSLEALKAHSDEPSHLHNALCCVYASKFGPAVEYCYCRICKEKTFTKMELLLHVRSKTHTNTLLQYPPNYRTFNDPENLFFIKELSSKGKAPKVSEQTEGSSLIEREKLRLGKEKSDYDENPALLNLSSTTSTSLKPVSCTLCQKGLPEISALEQHLLSFHGVNEAAVKWLTSGTTKTHEEKSLLTEHSKNTEVGKQKSIVFDPQRSATDEAFHLQDSSIQSSVAIDLRMDGKSLSGLKDSSQQNLAIGENLNKEEKTGTNRSAFQRYSKTELVRNTDKIDRNTEGRTGKDFSSNQQFYEAEQMQNPGTSSIYSSASQQFYEAEHIQNPGTSSMYSSSQQQFYEKIGMRNSDESEQNTNFDQERVNMNPPSCQQFHETENIPLVDKEKSPNSDENLNSSSSKAEVIVESGSEPNGDSKYEMTTDDSSNEQFSENEHRSDFTAGRKRKGSSSHNINTPSQKQFSKTEKMPPLGEETIPNPGKNLNSSSQSDATVIEYESELNGDEEHEIETDDSSNENFEVTEHGLPFSPPGRERDDSSLSEYNSSTPKRLLAIYDSSVAYTSPISQLDHNANRETKDSSSSGGDSVTHQQSPSTGDPVGEHDFPKSKSGLKVRKESSSSDDIFMEYDLSVGTNKSSVNSSPNQRYLLESETRSHLKDRDNLNLRENAVNDSPKSRQTAFARSQQGDNISVMKKVTDDSVNGQIMLYDCPNEYVAQFSPPNTPGASDPQMLARKGIGNIKISNVVSLAKSAQNSSKKKRS